MRPDKPKLQAQQKSGAKDQKKDLERDLENRRQRKAASRPGHDPEETALVKVRHGDRKGPTLH